MRARLETWRSDLFNEPSQKRVIELRFVALSRGSHAVNRLWWYSGRRKRDLVTRLSVRLNPRGIAEAQAIGQCCV
jgi:hypothetical protein